ncbi:hypothetical protein [Pelotalea chapellei]|uniref:Uncharacterized protein n=1 Tax=Pelotalea chapellei TaxID=44671 RepID=A0ABS5U551_9BACT|nr:hypothetical protein [Pelotalea chapellei]MBT1070779.1 hypothetical protein [Pelotalea chapellei]
MTTTDNAIVLYQSPDGAASLEVHLDHETVWLSQKQMAELFHRERSVITKHLRNVFSDGELDEKSNVQNIHFGIRGTSYLTPLANSGDIATTRCCLDLTDAERYTPRNTPKFKDLYTVCP